MRFTRKQQQQWMVNIRLPSHLLRKALFCLGVVVLVWHSLSRPDQLLYVDSTSHEHMSATPAARVTVASSELSTNIATTIITQTTEKTKQQQQIQQYSKPMPTHQSESTNDDGSSNVLQRTDHMEWCSPRPDDHVLHRIKVSNISSSSSSSPRILCFLMTHSGNHNTRIAAIVDTWGPRCDKLVIATNSSNTIEFPADNIETISTKAGSTYRDLWERLQEVMGAVWAKYGQDNSFDWFMKLDDDSYLIMENLKHFLVSSQVQSRHLQGEPLVYGHAFVLPWMKKKKDIITNRRNSTPIRDYRDSFWIPNKDSKTLIAQIKSETSSSWLPANELPMSPTNYTEMISLLLYASGGSGYVMNGAYVKAFVEVVQTHQDDYKNSGGVPEDMAHFAIMHHFRGIRLQSSRDALGRERFHYREPYKVGSDLYRESWEGKKHKWIGGLSTISLHNKMQPLLQLNEECCSTDTISFHYVDPSLMKYMHKVLYQSDKQSIKVQDPANSISECKIQPYNSSIPVIFISNVNEATNVARNNTYKRDLGPFTISPEECAAAGLIDLSCDVDNHVVYQSPSTKSRGLCHCYTSTRPMDIILQSPEVASGAVYRYPTAAYSECKRENSTNAPRPFSTFQDCVRQMQSNKDGCGNSAKFMWNFDSMECACCSSKGNATNPYTPNPNAHIYEIR